MQSAASALLAPLLRYVTDELAASWRRRLTAAAHRRYLSGSTFYAASQLAGMQASCCHTACLPAMQDVLPCQQLLPMLARFDAAHTCGTHAELLPGK